MRHTSTQTALIGLLCLLPCSVLGQAQKDPKPEHQQPDPQPKQVPQLDVGEQAREIEILLGDIELFPGAEVDLVAPDVLERVEVHKENGQLIIRVQQRNREVLIQEGFLEDAAPAEPLDLQPKPFVNPWADYSLDDVVAALDHEFFAKRESAVAHLLTDNTLSKEVLHGLIKQARSPEQRQRLLQVAEHHVLRELRERDFGQPEKLEGAANDLWRRSRRSSASVGYSYSAVLAADNPYVPVPGVRVNATMPGFPGYAYLRKGDIIVQIDGQGLSPTHQTADIQNWVQRQIGSRLAGDMIELTLVRQGALQRVSFACAQGQALDHMYTTNEFLVAQRNEPYKRAWLEARAAFKAQMPGPKTLKPVTLDVSE